ncbi:MAG: polyprenyl synthetase family protein [Acidobacteria bacterium]|nr:polyprenyl synthetase family protein [Acidobacteriota bacterium]
MSTPPTLTAYLDELQTVVSRALQQSLPEGAAPTLVIDAMQHALMSGGKRLRPCLTLMAAEAVAPLAGLTVPRARLMAIPSACAVEMIHCYSLVHDDLPAMDNDTLRRGQPTTHMVYGDGLAVLAGDGLLTEAFGVLAASPSPVAPPGSPEAPADRRLRVLSVLATAAGAIGMVGGQAIDLRAAGRIPSHPPAQMGERELRDMHARKTGALIRAAAVSGAMIVGVEDAVVAAVDYYAQELGLAFQIIDDVLDVEGSDATLGKTVGKDAAAGKPTYPALHGVTASRQLAAECVDRAKATLHAAGLEGRLTELADWSLARTT